MRYAVALPGENAECVCEGLLEVFEHIGAVPPVLVLDNATGAAHRGLVGQDRGGGGVFQRFVAHHRIEVRFCNPGAGNEKGSVGERGRVPAPQRDGARCRTPSRMRS